LLIGFELQQELPDIVVIGDRELRYRHVKIEGSETTPPRPSLEERFNSFPEQRLATIMFQLNFPQLYSSREKPHCHSFKEFSERKFSLDLRTCCLSLRSPLSTFRHVRITL
jgi:hypothetical protein